MSEENHTESPERDPEGSPSLVASWKGRRYVIIGIVAAIIAGASLIWYLRSGDEGRPVSPPSSVTTDGGTTPASTGDETIAIPAEQIERIGLKIESVGESLSSEAMTISATGVVQPNAYRETPVISLLGGIVRRIDAELGQEVGRGRSVAVIFSDDLAAAQARYLSLLEEVNSARQNYARAAKLVKISPVSSAEVDQALARLKTVEAELLENRKRHDRTVKLVAIGAASREELEQATTKLRSSEADLVEAKRRHDRAIQVAQINPVSRSEFEQAAIKRQTVESDLATARQRLLLLGLPAQRVNALRSPAQITSEAAVPAPVSGTVTKRDANVGQVVEPNAELMRITDLSTVWVIAQVFERDLANIREGLGASVATASAPDRLFRGQITYIDPNLNPETRTAQVRVELDNPAQLLKIGMYVNVAFGGAGMAEKTVPVIPSSALQNMGERQVVFVATDEPGRFLIRTVRIGKESDGRVTVLEGLNVGDRIVTEGSFLLRAELLKQNPTHH